MNPDFTLTEDSIRKLKQLVNKDRYQPPRVYHNTRPTDNAGDGGTIEFTILSIDTATSGPYTGLVIATVTIETAPCAKDFLIGEEVEVVDHSGCVFDLPEADLIGVWGWATERVALSLDPEASDGEITPCHWAADDRCCVAADGA